MRTTGFSETEIVYPLVDKLRTFTELAPETVEALSL